MALPLTQIKGVPDKSAIVRGMAYFADSGPLETVCGKCQFYGYYRESKFGKSYRTTACQMFKKLTGKFGPRIRPDTHSCKYFVQRETKKGG